MREHERLRLPFPLTRRASAPPFWEVRKSEGLRLPFPLAQQRTGPWHSTKAESNKGNSREEEKRQAKNKSGIKAVLQVASLFEKSKLLAPTPGAAKKNKRHARTQCEEGKGKRPNISSA